VAAKPSQDQNIEKSHKSQESQRSQSPTGLLSLPAAAPEAATCEADNLFFTPLLLMRMAVRPATTIETNRLFLMPELPRELGGRKFLCIYCFFNVFLIFFVF
jgi:hypothetical protein